MKKLRIKIGLILMIVISLLLLKYNIFIEFSALICCVSAALLLYKIVYDINNK